MKIYWKVDTKEYKKILSNFQYKGTPFNKELYNYLTNYIDGIVKRRNFIYIEFDSKKDNLWNTYWIWNFEPFNSFFGGLANIKEIRKQKLEKLQES